jgi:hypothetical protein
LLKLTCKLFFITLLKLNTRSFQCFLISSKLSFFPCNLFNYFNILDFFKIFKTLALWDCQTFIVLSCFSDHFLSVLSLVIFHGIYPFDIFEMFLGLKIGLSFSFFFLWECECLVDASKTVRISLWVWIKIKLLDDGVGLRKFWRTATTELASDLWKFSVSSRHNFIVFNIWIRIYNLSSEMDLWFVQY